MGFLILFLFCLCLSITENAASKLSDEITKFVSRNDNGKGTKWAILVAGSSDWENYRHQADICHAYQVLLKGGLHKDNIIVFMYDDIANHFMNPLPGVIINSYDGPDVYKGVVADYRGENVTAAKFLDCILGSNKGGGKELLNGPDDHIFIYYSGHGNAKTLSMPDDIPIYATDLRDVISVKQAITGYKSMVIYAEACLAGSMFENLYPDVLNVYAVTASNATENSYAFYCPRGIYTEFDTCLGDLFSISWIEDSEVSELEKETLAQQYVWVRDRVAESRNPTSNVQQYGNIKLANNPLSTYMSGNNPRTMKDTKEDSSFSQFSDIAFTQLDASLIHFQYKLKRATMGSPEYNETKKKLDDILSRIKYEDDTMEAIKKLLFRHGKWIAKVGHNGHSAGDEYCLKTLMEVYAKYCGRLSPYGLKHGKDVLEMCKKGVKAEELVAASMKVCST